MFNLEKNSAWEEYLESLREIYIDIPFAYLAVKWKGGFGFSKKETRIVVEELSSDLSVSNETFLNGVHHATNLVLYLVNEFAEYYNILCCDRPEIDEDIWNISEIINDYSSGDIALSPRSLYSYLSGLGNYKLTSILQKANVNPWIIDTIVDSCDNADFEAFAKVIVDNKVDLSLINIYSNIKFDNRGLYGLSNSYRKFCDREFMIADTIEQTKKILAYLENCQQTNNNSNNIMKYITIVKSNLEVSEMLLKANHELKTLDYPTVLKVNSETLEKLGTDITSALVPIENGKSYLLDELSDKCYKAALLTCKLYFKLYLINFSDKLLSIETEMVSHLASVSRYTNPLFIEAKDEYNKIANSPQVEDSPKPSLHPNNQKNGEGDSADKAYVAPEYFSTKGNFQLKLNRQKLNELVSKLAGHEGSQIKFVDEFDRLRLTYLLGGPIIEKTSPKPDMNKPIHWRYPYITFYYLIVLLFGYVSGEAEKVIVSRVVFGANKESIKKGTITTNSTKLNKIIGTDKDKNLLENSYLKQLVDQYIKD